MEGFFKVDNRVIDEIEFNNTSELGIYVIISRYSNNEQLGFPSLDTLTEKCRCSRKTAIDALKSLEERNLITIYRRFGKNNRYRVNSIKRRELPSSSNELGSSSELLYKEQYINIDKRREVLSEIYNLISKGTGDNVFLIQQIFTGRGLTDDELRTMRDKIGESDFLMGRLESKPTVRHYDHQKQIDKVRMGYYRNNERGQNSNKNVKATDTYKPPYHYEFEEKEVIHHEPNY